MYDWTHFIFKLSQFNNDTLGLLVVPQLMLANLELDEIPKKEREQFFMISGLCEVLPKSLQAQDSQYTK